MAQDKLHLIHELPHIFEIEDMIAFCKKYEHLYICGAAENQEYLLKYFDICGIKIEGYTVTSPADNCLTHYRQLPILQIDEVIQRPNTGVILGLSDKHYRYFIPKFRKVGFNAYFVMSEFNKRAIADQLKPRPVEEMTFEINLVDHCNLSCQMCDHYSQLSEECFVDMEQFDRDLKRIGEIFDHKVGYITLLGGEPTLHPMLIRCMEIVRREFANGQIILLTNGLLLPKLEKGPNDSNIWQACKDLGIHITVTVYPLSFDYDVLAKKAREYGVSLSLSSNIHAEELTKIVKISDKHTFDLLGKVGKEYFVSCLYFNHFNVLKDGKYYMCPIAAHSGIFNKAFGQELELLRRDAIDIYETDEYRSFAEFSADYVPFCRYCDIKNWHPHSQWKASSKLMEEYV